MIGKTISHYRVTAKLGAGGMGEVYLAHDERLEREVALKVLPARMLTDEAARKRFRKEALALSKLNHPNIATIYDFDTQDGVDFLVMEYVEGTTLSEKLSGHSLPEKDVARLGGQVADALEEAHEHGVIHRDLKPSNVMVTPKGQAKVLDFGLAKLVQHVSETAVTESLTEGPRGAGTLPYMAPEQLRGEEADARTDLYALGALLYEMATGERPFREDIATRLIDAILHQAPTTPRAINARVPPELERIILKCLEKNPGNRYQSAKDIEVDLRRLTTSTSAPAVRVAAPARMTRRKAALAAGIGLVMLAGVLIVWNKGTIGEWLGGGVSTAPIESIAVLPLDNLMGDSEQEYFVDAMTDALTSELGKIGALRVISRTSAQQIKKRMEETGESLQEIARELNLDAVVEGSVLRSGERVRVTAQLIHAATDRHLWSESYERDLTNVLRLQSEVARAIADKINVTVTSEERVRLALARTVNPEAHEAYLKGMYLYDKHTREDNPRAIEFAQQAIEIDPGYAPAYALLSSSYLEFGSFVGIPAIPASEARAKALAAAMKALDIDDTLAEAHVALGLILDFEHWDWAGAEREFKRAIELNPNSARAHAEYANYLGYVTVKDPDAAIREAKRAQELDPLSFWGNATVGLLYANAGKYVKASEEFQKSLKMYPHSGTLHWLIGIAHRRIGRYDEAIAEFEKAITLLPGNTDLVGALGHAYAAAGKRYEALKILDELKQLSKRGHVQPTTVSKVYAGLGQKDQAFEWLEKAYEEHERELVYIKINSAWVSLRSDPRYHDLLRRMNLPE